MSTSIAPGSNQESPPVLSRADVIALLRENLRIEVETNSEYTGGLDGGPLYRDSHVVKLTFDGETISEAYL